MVDGHAIPMTMMSGCERDSLPGVASRPSRYPLTCDERSDAMILNGGTRPPVDVRPREADFASLLATAETSPGSASRSMMAALARYREPRLRRSLGELAVTIVPFIGLWIAIWASLEHAYWLSLLLGVLAAGFLVRLFMIQHDCGHGSFFRRRLPNDLLGRAISVLTLTPYGEWRHTHAMHHATSGNLSRRGIGDVETLTVEEFRRLPAWRRLRYRLYRNPLVLLGFGPLFLFVVKYRVPTRPLEATGRAWLSAMSTNLAVAAVISLMIYLVGVRDLLLIQLPITLLASTIGVWLFYVQHQFEHAWWEESAKWSPHASALHGSSHYDLPQPLRWLTANIGMHHVHHLSSRIPSYRLSEVLRDHPELREVSRLTLRQSLGCLRLALWDEDKRRLVSFREASRSAGAAAS